MADDSLSPKEIVREFFSAHNAKNEAAVRKTLAEGFVHRNHPAAEPEGTSVYGDLRDIDRYLEAEFAYLNVFPDLEYNLDVLLAEGDWVACRWWTTVTHSGSSDGNDQSTVMASIEPTGEAITFSGLNIFHIEDGKITEMWGSHDDIGLFKRLGIVDIPMW